VLLATALLGTEQRRCAVVSPELEFLSTLDAVNREKDHEAWVLLASAYASTYRRAGQIPPEIPSAKLLPPAPAETRELCSAPVAARLASLLVEGKMLEPFLVELLTLLAGKARLVPPALLPELFNWARRDKERRALLVPVVGERGQWLASRNPEWKNVLKVDNPEAGGPMTLQDAASDEQALLAALDIKDNLLSKTFSVLQGRGLRGNSRLVQLVVDKLLAESKAGNTYYPEQKLVKIAMLTPPPVLSELTSRLQSALTKGDYSWLPKLADLLEVRRQMLEKVAHE
jgi:hypothetical protein